jgi:hypothetical protein
MARLVSCHPGEHGPHIQLHRVLAHLLIGPPGGLRPVEYALGRNPERPFEGAQMEGRRHTLLRRRRAEGFLLFSAHLARICAVAAAEFEVLADRVVEHSHGGTPYRARRRIFRNEAAELVPPDRQPMSAAGEVPR